MNPKGDNDVNVMVRGIERNRIVTDNDERFFFHMPFLYCVHSNIDNNISLVADGQSWSSVVENDARST
ncbi:MAG: hypothetical protein FDX12_02465 [Chlorobium sp.]|nr:MAG: hypothetical protein FDX12_02465 [Chlorobium sp.]